MKYKMCQKRVIGQAYADAMSADSLNGKKLEFLVGLNHGNIKCVLNSSCMYVTVHLEIIVHFLLIKLTAASVLFIDYLF